MPIKEKNERDMQHNPFLPHSISVAAWENKKHLGI